MTIEDLTMMTDIPNTIWHPLIQNGRIIEIPPEQEQIEEMRISMNMERMKCVFENDNCRPPPNLTAKVTVISFRSAEQDHEGNFYIPIKLLNNIKVGAVVDTAAQDLNLKLIF